MVSRYIQNNSLTHQYSQQFFPQWREPQTIWQPVCNSNIRGVFGWTRVFSDGLSVVMWYHGGYLGDRFGVGCRCGSRVYHGLSGHGLRYAAAAPHCRALSLEEACLSWSLAGWAAAVLDEAALSCWLLFGVAIVIVAEGDWAKDSTWSRVSIPTLL